MTITTVRIYRLRCDDGRYCRSNSLYEGGTAELVIQADTKDDALRLAVAAGWRRVSSQSSAQCPLCAAR